MNTFLTKDKQNKLAIHEEDFSNISIGSIGIDACLGTESEQEFGWLSYYTGLFTSVKVWNNTFWGQRIETSRKVTIPLAFSKCESEGRYKNFERAAHPSDTYDVGKLMPYGFDDTDPYKTIEGASYVLQTYPDKKLKAYIDSVLDIIAPAQEADGYLYTARTQNPKHPHFWAGDKRWSKEEDLSHELYNLGHMVEGA